MRLDLDRAELTILADALYPISTGDGRQIALAAKLRAILDAPPLTPEEREEAWQVAYQNAEDELSDLTPKDHADAYWFDADNPAAMRTMIEEAREPDADAE